MSNQLEREVAKMAFNGGIPAPYIKSLSKDMVEKLAGGYIANVSDYILWDSIRIQGGVAVGNEEVPLFTTLKSGAKTSMFNGLNTYTKTLRDTNMSQAAQIPSTHEIWVFSIQVFAASLGATQTYTGGAITDPTPQKAQSGTANQVALMCDGMYKNIIDGQPYEHRPFFMFPSDYGFSGFAGGAGGDPNQNAEVMVNNGFGRAEKLAIGHILKGGINFAPSVQFCTKGLTLNQDTQVWFLNKGIIMKPVA